MDGVCNHISLKHPPGHDWLHMWCQANAQVHFPKPAWHIWFEKNNCAQLLHRYQSGHLEPRTQLLQRTGFNGKLPVLKVCSCAEAIGIEISAFLNLKEAICHSSLTRSFVSSCGRVSLCMSVFHKPICNVIKFQKLKAIFQWEVLWIEIIPSLSPHLQHKRFIPPKCSLLC